jgi:hypothetical protein
MYRIWTEENGYVGKYELRDARLTIKGTVQTTKGGGNDSNGVLYGKPRPSGRGQIK